MNFNSASRRPCSLPSLHLGTQELLVLQLPETIRSNTIGYAMEQFQIPRVKSLKVECYKLQQVVTSYKQLIPLLRHVTCDIKCCPCRLCQGICWQLLRHIFIHSSLTTDTDHGVKLITNLQTNSRQAVTSTMTLTITYYYYYLSFINFNFN